MSRVLTLTARTGHWADGRQGRAGGVPQTPVQRDKQLARACMVPVFTKPDALPGAQVQFALRYRNGQGRTEEAGFDVGGLRHKQTIIMCKFMCMKQFIVGYIQKIKGTNQDS